MSSVQFGILAYVVVQFAIGLWVARRIKTTTDFLIAGRSLGLGLVSFSVFATFFGAEAIVGTSGAVYEEGLTGGRIDPFGYAVAIFIVGAVFAVPLWRRGIITFADFFRQRYSPRSKSWSFWSFCPVQCSGQQPRCGHLGRLSAPPQGSTCPCRSPSRLYWSSPTASWEGFSRIRGPTSYRVWPSCSGFLSWWWPSLESSAA